MDIDRMIRKLLNEQTETKTLGLNYNDQYDILQKGINSCPTFSNLVKGRTIKVFPSSEISKIPELAGLTEVAYISTPLREDGLGLIFFGVKDKETEMGKKQFLTYAFKAGFKPTKWKQGWGSDCDAIQELSQLGKDTLTPEQKRILDDYIKTNADTTAEYEPTGNMGEWTKKPYSDIIPGYKGTGYVWVQTSLQNVNANVLEDVDMALSGQGFTRIERDLDYDSPERNYGILLKDLVIYYPSLQAAATKSPDTKVFLEKGTFPIPDKESCRSVIKLLTTCSKTKGGAGAECYKNLLKNKYLALQCQNLKFVGGAFGLRDEFDDLLTDGTGKFGLGSIKAALDRGITAKSSEPQKNYSIKESIDKRVSKALNEEFKRIFKF
jgi:hypothetical protein